MNFAYGRERLWDFIKARLFLVVGVIILLSVVAGFVFQKQIKALITQSPIPTDSLREVDVPTIIGGDLVLPKVLLGGSNSNLDGGRLRVLSANLVGVFDSPGAAGTAPKLVALRIIGELQNVGSKTVEGISPVVRFFDSEGKEVGLKIGIISTGFSFYGLESNAKALYDVTVESPPVSDKLEIVINAPSGTSSALFESLKIASRSFEVKTAKYQEGSLPAGEAGQKSAVRSQQPSGAGTESGQASPSGGPAGSEGQIVEAPAEKEIEYYTVSGSVKNGFKDPVSDVAIFAWIKDSEGKVFSWGRQDFKNDLLTSGKSVDFRINLLPFKTDQKYASYEVFAWGRRYTL